MKDVTNRKHVKTHFLPCKSIIFTLHSFHIRYLHYYRFDIFTKTIMSSDQNTINIKLTIHL